MAEEVKKKVGRPKGSKDTVSRKGKRPDNAERKSKENSPAPSTLKKALKNEKKEDITRIIGQSVQYFRTCTVKNDEELMDRIDDYFHQCMVDGEIPTVEGMALAIGITPQRLRQWEYQIDGRNESRALIVQKAKAVLASIDASLVSEGKIPQVSYIFRAKNFFGMKDQQDIVVTPNNPLGENVDVEKIKQKYLENTYGVMDGEFRLEVPENSSEETTVKIE